MAKPIARPLKHLIYFFKDLKQTGSIAPSSKFLAQDLVSQLKKRVACDECKPLKILEVGPGTGPLTKQIVKHLRPNDKLDVVEIHKKFYQIVKSRYRQQNLQIHHADILQFQPDYKYDFIFSSLPYENMPEEISREIWKKKLTLCSEEACISYFKYVKFRNFKSDFEEEVVKKYGRDKKVVLLNLPPAKVYTLEISGQPDIKTPTIESSNVA
ncbi:class I SAM-dependent methyltransferase [Fodinibius salsisoli]|uniref:Methyltransferase domain-containing protein n=1 Tax=Fodinibius salsisoli TaxID=2820877 RepID=A0ABT3PNQ9_9BACT|nr:rRNA adenine N-6-methyltransferase family protein [Fodinibius salsisoli]MCW9707481.1 methyltransferase domain-containing protein [Fodinibius salsisoli]